MNGCVSGSTVCLSCGEAVLVPTLGLVYAHATPRCAEAGSSCHLFRFPQQMKGTQKGLSLRCSKWGNELLLVAKGPGRGRSPSPHFGDARVPTKGSSVLCSASHACGSADSVLPVIQSGQSRRSHVESVTESQ